MRNYSRALKNAARIAAVRRQGDLYSEGGDVAAKRAAIRQLKRAGFPTLNKEEIQKHRFKVERKDAS